MLRKFFNACVVFFGLITATFGGEATVSKSVDVNATFDRVINVVKMCEDDLFDAANVTVLERNGDLVKLRVVNVLTTHYMTVKVSESIDAKAKKAVFKCEMVESDGFVTKQLSVLEIYEKDGKVVINATFSATVPEVRSPFIKNDQAKALNKILAKIELNLVPMNRLQHRF